jgi:hypothetical protein
VHLEHAQRHELRRVQTDTYLLQGKAELTQRLDLLQPGKVVGII